MTKIVWNVKVVVIVLLQKSSVGLIPQVSTLSPIHVETSGKRMFLSDAHNNALSLSLSHST